jgi:hypothetical protein
MIQAPTPEDYKLASDAKQRRDMDENAQPTNLELAAINRILVQEARERLAKDLDDECPSP